MIRQAGIFDFENIKKIMLEALETDPTAFTSDKEEYEVKNDSWWKMYLQSYLLGVNSKLYFYEENGKQVGMNGIIFINRNRSKHVSMMVWFYVNKEFRGKGIGKKLLKQVMDSAHENENIQKVSLTVVSSQVAAIEMYKKEGFEIIGTQKNELKINDQFYDFILMEKFIRWSTN